MLIETIEQLDALPIGSVVWNSESKRAWEITRNLSGTVAMSGGTICSLIYIDLPAELLYPRQYDDTDVERVAEALAAERFRLHRNTGSDNYSLARAALKALETTP